MPCQDYGPHPDDERAGKLAELVDEARGKPFNHKRPRAGHRDDIHDYTRTLCEWCRAHPERISGMSLEFQIWWRDHQEIDRRREQQEQRDRRRAELRASARKKLTAAEFDALLDEQ